MVTQSRTIKLTKSHIDRLAYDRVDNKQQILWDAALPGFGARVYPSGKKAFVLSYRASGRKHIIVVGRYGVITLDEARTKARKLLAQVSDGHDPVEKRRSESAGNSVRDLAAAYIDRYARQRKKSWKEDDRRLRVHIVPALGTLPLASVKRADVASLHTRIGSKHPYEANRILELAGKMFDLARQWGFLLETAPNPARGVEPFKEKKRDRWVTADEMPRLGVAVDAEENLYIRAAIWLYLFTGVRRSELLRAKWEDINWTRNDLRLPETKAGRVHYVPLSEPAVALLKSIPRVEGNPHILPGHRRGAHLVNIDKPWRRIRKQAGLEDVRLHDLRRTVGSWLV